MSCRSYNQPGSVSFWIRAEIDWGGISLLFYHNVNRYLPGFADNEQVKQAYGMTFQALAPILGLPENILNAMLAELDQLQVQ